MVSKRVLHIAEMTPRQLEAHERELHAMNLSKRHGIPVDLTAPDAGTTLQAVLKHARPALKRVGGRWMARASDRLERRMRFYDAKGSYYVVVGSSDSASRISAYHRDGVGRFVETGSRTKLQGFAGK